MQSHPVTDLTDVSAKPGANVALLKWLPVEKVHVRSHA